MMVALILFTVLVFVTGMACGILWAIHMEGLEDV